MVRMCVGSFHLHVCINATYNACIRCLTSVFWHGKMVEDKYPILNQKLLQLLLSAVNSVIGDLLSPPAVRVPAMGEPHIAWIG